ncbi:MAG TPA: tetratricopeptide repeat protein [Planctomycetaceae bacterium]|nr:tetratricopeptide repeat protein [Planctomycetaceae bacterium]
MKRRTKRKPRKRSADISSEGPDAEPPTLADVPFRELVQKDPELKEIRQRYRRKSAELRREAAEDAMFSVQAKVMLARLTGRRDLVHPTWHDAAVPLAIDPDYAPAILTVGSLEYRYGRPDEAMALFLRLTTFPPETEGLAEIIDQAGDFLIAEDDYDNAEILYSAAAAAQPEVAVFRVGWGCCASQRGRKEEAVEHFRRAVELEPDNYVHLNDLGYALLEAGQYDGAEEVLRRAVELAPDDYDLAKGNLDHLTELRAELDEE